jgi:sugar phosphate isomerase/epimerase
MSTRREFIRTSLMGAGALAIAPYLRGFASQQPIGLQLYTVRKQAESDLPGTLKRIRAIGYDEVEPYWNVYSHPARELKQMILEAGLRAQSGHFDYDGLDSKLDYAKELGLDYMVCPMLPQKMWNSGDGFKQAAEQFNRWGEQIQRLGMTFAFHNHNYEFHKFGDQTGFDILTKNTDPKLVKLEMDCYWMTQAGQSPVAMMERFRDRIRLLHVKDRQPGFPTSQTLNRDAEHFAEVGKGTINWGPILSKAESIGVQHFFVEQDESEDPMKSIAISHGNLSKLLSSRSLG